MKFDVVIMNPPYQAPKAKEQEGRGKCGKSLWEEFVKKSFEVCKENGFVCAIHPSRWRKPNSKIGELIRSNQLHYIEMHDLKDGKATFGCQTDYDWYVATNAKCSKKTVVVDQNKEIVEIDLRESPFIPNSKFLKVMDLVAKDGEEKVDLLYNCAYHTQSREKDGTMSATQTDICKYPCVYYINSKSIPILKYSSVNNRGNFGIPKVIFASGVFQSVGVIVDKNGEFGLTQFAKGIVDSKHNLPLIAKALMSVKFKTLVKSFTMSTTELDKDIVATFRKDFWKEFVDENGKEI